ncbi:hypothetical protein UCRPA7_8305 [Phaeoacremonium minimum UCRPA7]|uniref:Uncharacterized protein n=1 Tax=Phaeoacremonium minimum (strain UCR-PA7) TaxID=1286976 RepID=R8BAA0_PHAM7|nr:hypothetical protein UCRPA7_8305 [Phaeoacremonium minimum UCRPA7]EON96202.1 hypothetical protein UCRPA7_8305 [Phaeoacremonium minimum UCRPA7]
MKLSLLRISLWLAAFSCVTANFDVYMVERTIVTDVGVSINKVWQVFEAEPKNCDEVFAAKTFVNSGDVSGTKTGVRCAGSGCDYKPPPGNIDVLEMNFHGTDPVYHWTLYKDRGWTMVGLDGNTYGDCIVFPNGDYNCHDSIYYFLEGYRKFRCLTKFTAGDLN